MDKSDKRVLKQLGATIAKLRTQKRLTQEQLAERAGLDRMTVAFVEGGRRWPRPSTLVAMAEALDVRLVDFFRGL